MSILPWSMRKSMATRDALLDRLWPPPPWGGGGWRPGVSPGKQRGAVSLLGALFVIIIFSAALASALAFGARLHSKAQTTNAVDAIATFAGNLKTAFAGRYDIGVLTNEIAMDKGLVPVVMQSDSSANCSRGAFCSQLNRLPNGDSWSIQSWPLSPSLPKTYYMLAIVTDKPQACNAYAQYLVHDWRAVFVGGFQMWRNVKGYSGMGSGRRSSRIIRVCEYADERGDFTIYAMY